jgi:hypothetical protein
MKYSLSLCVGLVLISLAGCERPATVVTTPPAVVPVPTPVPGPQGAPGAPGEKGESGPMGAQGPQGEQGKKGSGDTVVIVPPAPEPRR